MKIAIVKKRNEFILNVTEMQAYGLRANGYNVEEIEWNNPRQVIQQLEHIDYAFIPASDLCHPNRPEFATRDFIQALNRLKAKVIMDVNDEPTIHKALEPVIWPCYRGMVWPGNDRYLDKWTQCERVIYETVVGEHYLYHKTKARTKQYDVIFNGSLYDFRRDFLTELIGRLGPDIHFQICSKYRGARGVKAATYWKNRDKDTFFTHDELNTIYNQAKILLSFGVYADGIQDYSGRWDNIEGGGDRAPNYPCRIFSFLGTGSFTLADRRSEQGRYFREGAEAVTYNSIDECAEKIRYYLQHEKEREQIAAAGYERYLAEHTIEKKMGRVMAAVLE